MPLAKHMLDELRKQKQDLMPTAPVGLKVQWFDRNNENACYSAEVTAIQGPGKVELAVQKPRSNTIHKQGVMHRSHPIHLQPSNPTTVKNGSWDYIRAGKPPQADLQLHLELLEKREKALIDEERVEREKAEIRKKVQAQMEQEFMEPAPKK